MTDEIRCPVEGGCPKCGNPAIEVPKDYDDDTVITCSKCGHSDRWIDFYGRRGEDEAPADD